MVGNPRVELWSKICGSSHISAGILRSRTFLTEGATGRRIRAITMDVTGTMVAFSGSLGDHYANAGHWCGVTLSPSAVDRMSESFHMAYRETSRAHPCFGGQAMSAKEWWRACVLRSFELSGAKLTKSQEERVFQRVYSVFGSHATYTAFLDAKPFVQWAHRHGIVCGVISNADERYGDSILPMLGLSENLCFMCFSKEIGVEKPDARIFEAARKAAEPWLENRSSSKGPLLASEVLHIGNDYEKDYVGARDAGFHAILLDRFRDEVADEWRQNGVPVFEDLMDVIMYAAKEGFS